MSQIKIVCVSSRREERQFVGFPSQLYKDCPQWVPAMEGDEYATFDPQRNGAFEFCEADRFLALDGGQVVGRGAAIINHRADDKEMAVRFGWLDFIEDIEVLRSLMDAVERWGARRGRTVIKGPWGFTDMDKEGLLVDGYDHVSPFTCIYNYPYYDRMLAQLGFVKDVDWTQRIMTVSPELPPMFQYSSLIGERFGIRVVHPRNMRELGRRYGKAIFHMYNEAFAPLEAFSPLSDRQIDTYLKTYIPILDKDFVALAVDNDDQPAGFLICVPSLSQALRKAHGRLSPLGLVHIARAMRTERTLEALLIGVSPHYQNCGVPVLLFEYLHKNCIRRGISSIIFNPQLEENYRVQNLFGEYHPEPYMRRRAYRKNM